jgi:chromosomal replication initiator protein
MPPVVQLPDVLRVVANHYDLPVLELLSRRRPARTALARQVAMWLACRCTQDSVAQIGAGMGDRDRTTILYGVSRIDGLIHADPRFAADVAALHRTLTDRGDE